MSFHSSLHKARGAVNTDTPLPELDPLTVLQLKIDEANRIIREGDPLTIAGALAMEAKARADVWEIVKAQS